MTYGSSTRHIYIFIHQPNTAQNYIRDLTLARQLSSPSLLDMSSFSLSGQSLVVKAPNAELAATSWCQMFTIQITDSVKNSNNCYCVPGKSEAHRKTSNDIVHDIELCFVFFSSNPSVFPSAEVLNLHTDLKFCKQLFLT